MGPGKLLALLAISLLLLGSRDQGSPPDLSSPKAAIRSFVEAAGRRDIKTMAACVEGAQESPELNQSVEGPILPQSVAIKDVILETNGDQAKVAVEVTVQGRSTLRSDAPLVTVTVIDMFVLHKVEGSWRIVPDAALLKSFQNMDAAATRQIEVRPLGMLAALVGSPKEAIAVFIRARSKAQATACLSNTRQVALAIMMYTQDYDECYPRKKAEYADLIFPYIKNKAVFRCPTDEKGETKSAISSVGNIVISYSLNANLQGISLAAIEAPAQTVMVYEGKNGKLDFRHNGLAAIAFVDGHAKLVDEAGAKELYWYPGGKNPSPPVKPPVKPAVKPKKKK